MIKRMLVNKVGFGFLLSCVCLFSIQTQGAIIASFDTGANVEISSTSITNEFDTELFFDDVFADGNGTADASGSGDSGIVVLGANEIGTVNAAASGDVDGGGGFAAAEWLTGGYFFFDNTTNSDITVDMTFDISWFASIFTTSPNEEAYATAGVFIEDSFGDVVFAEFIEVDSLIEGAGAFDFSETFSIDFSVTVGDMDYEEYFLIVDAFGFVEVPEPSGFFLAGLAMLFAVRKRKHGG